MNPVVEFGAALWIAGLLFSPALADGCAKERMTRTAVLALDARRGLQALPAGDGQETDVSAKTRKAIATFKDQLDDYVSAAMRCEGANAQPRALEKSLGNFAGVKLPEDRLVATNARTDDVRYGDDLVFEVRVPQPGLMGIVARFGIECGEDAMLMVFERRSDGWAEALRTTSPPYQTVAGGWWTFDYAISPRDKDGHWFVVTKNVAPWCSSTWSEIRYAVLRSGADAAHPRTLFSKSDSIWWGTDRTGDLKVDATGFDLRWRAESMDDAVHNREWIAHYRVEDDRVYRTAPIAESPRDFADEWVRLDWRDARNWTVAAAYGLKPLHDRLHGMHSLDYVAIRRCGEADTTEIEVEPILAADDRHIFFEVSIIGKHAGRQIMLMSDVSLSADPRCKGPNLFDINKAQ